MVDQVDMQEFLISLSNFAGGTKDDKLRFAFMVFDEDGNGVITQQVRERESKFIC